MPEECPARGGLQELPFSGAGAGEAVECLAECPGAEVPMGACADRLPRRGAFLGRFWPEERLVYANPPGQGSPPVAEALAEPKGQKRQVFGSGFPRLGVVATWKSIIPNTCFFHATGAGMS